MTLHEATPQALELPAVRSDDRETQRLELHHHDPFARGGPPTTENLSLYCSVHNALAAERDFGRYAVLEKREQRSYFTARTVARTAVPEK